MKENRQCGAVLAMHQKGFVSLYFLVMFLILTVLVILLLNRTDNRTRTAINITKTNAYLRQEAAVLSFLKCHLKEGLEEGSYTENNVSFSVNQTASGWTCSISSPLSEILDVECDSHGAVYDYSFIRTETAA